MDLYIQYYKADIAEMEKLIPKGGIVNKAEESKVPLPKWTKAVVKEPRLAINENTKRVREEDASKASPFSSRLLNTRLKFEA